MRRRTISRQSSGNPNPTSSPQLARFVGCMLDQISCMTVVKFIGQHQNVFKLPWAGKLIETIERSRLNVTPT